MRAVDRAHEIIRSHIASGRFSSQDRLREEELAVITGVSRTPVREALQRLSAEGFVELTPNRGARVSSWSRKDVEEIFELRALLESHAARLAAKNADDEQIARLGALADSMLDVGRDGADLAKVTDLNNEFHRLVLTAGRNKRLVAQLSGLVQVPLVYRTFFEYSPDALRRSLAHHRELVDAIASRDPAWAESVMRSHLLAARAELLKAIEASPDGLT